MLPPFTDILLWYQLVKHDFNDICSVIRTFLPPTRIAGSLKPSFLPTLLRRLLGNALVRRHRGESGG